MGEKNKNKSNKSFVIFLVIILMLSLLAIVLISTKTPKTEYGTGKSIELITAENLNSRLEKVDTVKYKTVSERFNKAGIKNAQLIRLNDRYLYSYKDNRVIVLDDAGYVAYSIGSYKKDTLLLEGNDLFSFRSSDALSSDYSNYLVKGNESVIEVSTGLDVGETAVTVVNFVRSGESVENAIICTESQSITVNIDDETDGSIIHYGTAGIVNVVRCGNSSYHEYGTVDFIEISKGRIVLEPTAKTEAIHLSSKKENGVTTNVFDSIIIANNGVEKLPEIITRDKVSVVNPTLVTKVEDLLADSIEEVYVYPFIEDSVQTGTTEKTATQNKDVLSDLGLKIIDSNQYSGEKALSGNEIEIEKENYAVLAKTAEFNEKKKSDSRFNFYVARIGETGYESLQDAITAVNDGEIIAMLKNVTVSDWVEINRSGISFTIDVSGKEIERADASLFDIYSEVIIKDSSGTGKIKAKNRVLYCNAGAYCTLESGNLFNSEGSIINVYGDYAKDSETKPVFIMNGGNVVCDECFYMDAQKFGAKLIINGGNVSTQELIISAFNNKNKGVEIEIHGGTMKGNGDYGITINGNYGGATVNISGGEIYNENGCAIYMPGQNEYVIGGGKFTGRESLVVKGGNWTITGGEFIAFGESKNPEMPDGSGYSETGDSLYIEDNYGDKTSPHNIVMNISGAKFIAQKGYALSARFSSSNEGKIPAVINIGENVTLTSGANKKKVKLSNGFLGSVNGIEQDFD